LIATDPPFSSLTSSHSSIQRLIARSTDSIDESLRSFIASVHPSLVRWFDWLRRTQYGIVANSFRWRGRTENHTLSSGLDDFPRATPPSEGEMHVDLLCWMTKFAQVLSTVSHFLGNESESEQYHKLFDDYKAAIDGTRTTILGRSYFLFILSPFSASLLFCFV
jgi:mannosyl-oligosaccharide glucosidase